MQDITSTNLDLAIMDQVHAGHYGRRPYAYTVGIHGDQYILGIAVANERGYHPVRTTGYITRKKAQAVADGMNAHLGLSNDEATAIIVSTMGGRPYRKGAA